MSDRPDHKRGNALSRLGELFDASALGLVTLLLLGASLFMTWRGMSDFIASRDFGDGAVSQGLIFVIVATLSLAMYVALREMVAPYYVRGWWSAIWKRVVAGILYSVLAVWSVGFGYGFWWSLVAGQDATEVALQQSVTSVREETSDMRARLGAAGSVMASAEALSNNKAEDEAARGGTCGVGSPAGPGPLSRARRETQAQIAALSASVRQEWQLPLVARLADLEGGLQAALDDNTALAGEGRKARFEGLGRETQAAAQEIGADATARGRTIAAQLRAKASQLSVPPINGRVSYCYDPDLSASLTSAANELEQTYEIEVTPFRYAEGADGVARAIEDLIGRAGNLIGIGSGEQAALTGRDLIALLAALGVDLALFIFGLLRGSGGRVRAVDGNGPVIEEVVTVIEAVPAQPTLPSISRTGQNAQETAEEDTIIEAEFTEALPGALKPRTFEPDSQIDEAEQVADLMYRVEQLKAGIAAATLNVDRSPLRNKLSDALRALGKLGYFETGASDKHYNESLHEVVLTKPSDKPEGYILEIIRPRFDDREGRLREKARVIVSSGPEGL